MVEHVSGPAADHKNNFDTLRLLAAGSVLVSHSFTLGGAGAEPLVNFSRNHQTSLGHVAVLVFFAISGYLITASYLSLRKPLAFVWRRALRILPALFVVLAASAFIIGPAISTLPISDYFMNRQPYTYVAANMVFETRYSLPGLFSSTPYPKVVNGSLWTLAPEVACYVLVLVLGLCRSLNGWVLFALAVVTTILLAFHPGSHRPFLQLLAPFIVGAFFYVASVKLDWRIALISVFACIGSLHFGGFSVVGSWCGSYSVHFLARSPAVRLPRLPFDPSYGIYIWAFPIQQLIAEHLSGRSNWPLSVILALTVTFALATASYFVVERPALRLKNIQFGRGGAIGVPSTSAIAPPGNHEVHDFAPAAGQRGSPL